jgi:hypothetical protein
MFFIIEFLMWHCSNQLWILTSSSISISSMLTSIWVVIDVQNLFKHCKNLWAPSEADLSSNCHMGWTLKYLVERCIRRETLLNLFAKVWLRTGVSWEVSIRKSFNSAAQCPLQVAFISCNHPSVEVLFEMQKKEDEKRFASDWIDLMI